MSGAPTLTTPNEIVQSCGKTENGDNRVHGVVTGTIRTAIPALVMSALTAMAIIAAQYTPPATGQMAVVFPPFTDEVTAWQLDTRKNPRTFGAVMIH